MVCDDQRVRVKINGGAPIPTVNEGCTTELTSDAQQSGADITRLSEVYLPIEWKDENVTSSIQSFDPASQGQYDLATLEWQSVRGGEWTKVHRGFVRGVSGAADMGVAKMIVSDPAAMMTAVPFSKNYKQPSVGQVFNDVADTFRENTPFNPVVKGGAPSRSISSNVASDSELSVEGFLDFALGGVDEAITGDTTVRGTFDIPDTKSFKSNRHSCADALNWATDITNTKWYFAFGGGDGFVLNLVYDDGSQAVTFSQRTSHGQPIEQRLNDGGSLPDAADSELDIITNDALSELFPINTLTVKGATGVSIHGFETRMLGSKKAPYVKVQYPPLVQRAGGNVVGKTIETDNVTIESATNTAKKKLEQYILDSGTGSMMCYGNGHPKPYDYVVAKPECNDVLTTGVDPLPYEVASVTHKKSAWEEMTTEINVSPVVHASGIIVEEAEMRKV